MGPGPDPCDRNARQRRRLDQFKLTAYYYPGQTLYHAALLVEGKGLRMLFVGDSHTPAGIERLLRQNRNWLGTGVGFDRCIALIEKLRPTHLFNCHVNDAFDFIPEECRFMRENLAQRERLFGQLVPWDHANYALDDSWVRCHPYEQTVAPGARIDLGVVVTITRPGRTSGLPRTSASRDLWTADRVATGRDRREERAGDSALAGRSPESPRPAGTCFRSTSVTGRGICPSSPRQSWSYGSATVCVRC